MKVALVNTNRMWPPIGPVGLEYVAEALHSLGHQPEVLDLCWEENTESAISSFFKKKEFGLIGLSIRNTDDCAYGSKQSFIHEYADIARYIRACTDAPVVLGGVGFSVMPVPILERVEVDLGIWGDGEFILPLLVEKMVKKDSWLELPNLIHRTNKGWTRNPIVTPSLDDLPLMNRGWFNNLRYYYKGGQAGFETKRGCPCKCIYCADPVAKGREVRLRSPRAVVHELKKLVEMGIIHFHTCDSEFNIPEYHGEEVCEEIIKQNMGQKLQWYAYCAPTFFSRELARLLHSAGCVGINFGTDSGDDSILKRLGRNYTANDIENTVQICKDVGITVMLDLLLGTPGETEKSIVSTIELMKRVEPDCVGISVGVRIYPGTFMGKLVEKGKLKEGLSGKPAGTEPIFYIEPDVAPFIFDLLDRLIGNDPRFYFMNPSKPEVNYNYNANQRLMDAINNGFRGAYWDILRKYSP